MQIGIVVNQIIIFTLLMFIGLIGAKTKILTKEALSALSKLIVKIILPALIFSVVADSGVTAEEFLIGGRFALGVLICFALLITVGIGMSKISRLEGKTANIFIALTTFGNMGFMGIPLIQAIFKEPVAQVCISIYAIIDMALLWTFGVYLCSRHREDSNPMGAVKNIVNPTTVALIIGFFVMFFAIPIPSLLMNTITGLGGTTKYLTLMYLGGVLAYVSPSSLIKKPSIFLLTLIKMLILPLFVYFLLGLFLSEIPRLILTLIVGLPSMTTVAMIATAYQSDDEYATEVIFVTTLASLITLPLVSFLVM